MIRGSGDSDEQLRHLLELCRSFADGREKTPPLTPKRSGPHRRPGRVSDAWALGGGVLLILISLLGAFLSQRAC
jgi:hypothetical protein